MEIEAERMFKITLARMLIDMKNYEQGALARYGYAKTNQTRPAACDTTFVFRSQGWQNINVTGSAWVLVACCVVLTFAIPVNENDLLVGLLWHSVSPFSRYLCSVIAKAICSTYNRINARI